MTEGDYEYYLKIVNSFLKNLEPMRYDLLSNGKIYNLTTDYISFLFEKRVEQKLKEINILLSSL